MGFCKSLKALAVGVVMAAGGCLPALAAELGSLYPSNDVVLAVELAAGSVARAEGAARLVQSDSNAWITVVGGTVWLQHMPPAAGVVSNLIVTATNGAAGYNGPPPGFVFGNATNRGNGYVTWPLTNGFKASLGLLGDGAYIVETAGGAGWDFGQTLPAAGTPHSGAVGSMMLDHMILDFEGTNAVPLATTNDVREMGGVLIIAHQGDSRAHPAMTEALTRQAGSISELALVLEAMGDWLATPYSQFLADGYTDQGWFGSSEAVSYANNEYIPYPGIIPPPPDLALLLHMDGEIGGTNGFTDASANAVTVYATNVSRAAEAKSSGFGQSLLVPNATDANLMLHKPELDLGTNDFTISMWFYATDDTGYYGTMIGSPYESGYGFVCFQGYFNCLVLGVPGNDRLVQYNYTTDWETYETIRPVNAWHHLAVTRSGMTVRMYLDGALQRDEWNPEQIISKAEYGGPVSFGHPMGCTIGGRPWIEDVQSIFAGKLDEIAIVKGRALWDSDDNFTPPNAAYYAAAHLASRPWATATTNNSVTATVILDAPEVSPSNVAFSVTVDGNHWKGVPLATTGAWRNETNSFRYTGSTMFAQAGSNVSYRVAFSNGTAVKLKGSVIYVEDL